MSQPTCATCRHAIPDDGDKGLKCRRFPPSTTPSGCYYAYPPIVRQDGVCGEHTPRPDEAGPGLPRPWEWDATYAGVTRAIVRGNPRCHIEIMPNGIVSVAGAYVEDVEAVIAAHRARVGGAS